FHALGGNVDDSVMSQVYNNIPENEVSIEAVEATRGLVLWYGDEVVRANFFSTSAGMTANSGEVWASGTAFPGHTPTFLEARPQFAGAGEGMNLSGEAQAAEFFRNQEMDAYDSHSPWFRWQVEMTPAEIAASVNAQLEARFAANPSLIRTAGADEGWHSRPVASIGSLRSLQVLRRGEGGNIMELRITGDAADIIVATEFNIRSLLRPARSADGGRDIPLRRHDGSTLLNHSMLPSGFFSIEKVLDEEGAIEWIIFHGGGHGHGVGMSQNGVRGMVERGYSFDEIIRHFYPGVVLEAIDIEF
ncbi:MAG: SpoIID/LytB domain-containing protein, partial [Defluviitaleaceae bacterium]|nr:SpoIID/LytB domain-containing protein [Defluviitaleaceae bacterium]